MSSCFQYSILIIVVKRKSDVKGGQRRNVTYKYIPLYSSLLKFVVVEGG